MSAGRLSEATTVFKETLAGRERILGRDHPSTLITRNNLAAAYMNGGRNAEAVAFYVINLQSQERTLGPAHPQTLVSRNNLANAYFTGAKYRQAPQSPASIGIHRSRSRPSLDVGRHRWPSINCNQNRNPPNVNFGSPMAGPRR